MLHCVVTSRASYVSHLVARINESMGCSDVEGREKYEEIGRRLHRTGFCDGGTFVSVG